MNGFLSRARAPVLFHYRDRVAVGFGSESQKKSRVVVGAGRAAEWERTLPKGIAGWGKQRRNGGEMAAAEEREHERA